VLTAVVNPAPADCDGGRHDAAKGQATIRIETTANGVRFGVWNDAGEPESPALFVFASTIEGTLGEPYYRQCGNVLAKAGYVCVSLDLPGHGSAKREDEREGMAGWRDRTDAGEDFVEPFCREASAVLDHLIAKKTVDSARVAACGTSRGGFMALHWAAREARVQCAAAFAPVTHLGKLREFQGAEEDALVQSLSLRRAAEVLAGRAVWLVIGDQDERVGTDAAIEFSRAVSAASVRHKRPSRIELLVLPEPRGHTTPVGASERAAAWMLSQMK
jgi:dienelactone hydrolase